MLFAFDRLPFPEAGDALQKYQVDFDHFEFGIN